ncbi:MAG: thioredoxin TrxC [Hydrogenophilaceae bacterium]|nr:thioredoxin TrxC [Hydrogenophilaceae bacterium]
MSDSLHIVCPHCQAVNRLPAVRLNQAPNCGQCHRPLFEAHPLELSQATFQKHLTRNDIPLLVDFWAPWCGPCKVMAPQFNEAARLLEPKVRIAKVNTEAEQMLGAEYGIRSIPTLALFRGAREIARQAGAMGAQDIVRWVRSILDERS